jgi:hypothetical protein
MRGFETVGEKGGGHSSERAKPYAKDPAWVATSGAVLRVVGVLSDNRTEPKNHVAPYLYLIAEGTHHLIIATFTVSFTTRQQTIA